MAYGLCIWQGNWCNVVQAREPRTNDSMETHMQPARRNALIWLLAGMAFVAAGILMPHRQMSFFAVAVLDFAVSVITLRRGNSQRRSVE
jgi:hypothetical protein